MLISLFLTFTGLVLAQPLSEVSAARPLDPLSPSDRAEKIARASTRVTDLHQWLVKRVKAIHPDGKLITGPLKQATLDLLGKNLAFRLGERLKEEASLRSSLKARLGGDKAFQLAGPSLIPQGRAMSFLAAPGASWDGHHVYPGGLVTHTYTTAASNLEMASRYKKAFGVKVSEDLLLLAAIWHDAAKTWVLQWNANGTATTDEGKIAGAGSHHVLGIAEAVRRGFPPSLLVAMASAHDAPTEGEPGYQKVVDYLAAAAILADTGWHSVGLKETKGVLSFESPPPVEAFINHLGDADWVMTEQATKATRPLVNDFLAKLPKWRGQENEVARNWESLRLYARFGEIAPYSIYSSGGADRLEKWVKQESGR